MKRDSLSLRMMEISDFAAKIPSILISMCEDWERGLGSLMDHERELQMKRELNKERKERTGRIHVYLEQLLSIYRVQRDIWPLWNLYILPFTFLDVDD